VPPLLYRAVLELGHDGGQLLLDLLDLFLVHLLEDVDHLPGLGFVAGAQAVGFGLLQGAFAGLLAGLRAGGGGFGFAFGFGVSERAFRYTVGKFERFGELLGLGSGMGRIVLHKLLDEPWFQQCTDYLSRGYYVSSAKKMTLKLPSESSGSLLICIHRAVHRPATMGIPSP
jgi:hypothetical protein